METLYETLTDAYEAILTKISKDAKINIVKSGSVVFKVKDTVVAKADRKNTGYGWVLNPYQ